MATVLRDAAVVEEELKSNLPLLPMVKLGGYGSRLHLAIA
jgi:hypothetical protein